MLENANLTWTTDLASYLSHSEQSTVLFVFDITAMLVELLQTLPFKRLSSPLYDDNSKDSSQRIIPRFLFPDSTSRYSNDPLRRSLEEAIRNTLAECKRSGASSARAILIHDGVPPTFFVPVIRKKTHISAISRKHCDLVGFLNDAYAGSDLHGEISTLVERVCTGCNVKVSHHFPWKDHAILSMKNTMSNSAVIYWGIDDELILLLSRHTANGHAQHVFVSGELANNSFTWTRFRKQSARSRNVIRDSDLEALMAMGYTGCLPSLMMQPATFSPDVHLICQQSVMDLPAISGGSTNCIQSMMTESLHGVVKTSIQHVIDNMHTGSNEWKFKYYECMMNINNAKDKEHLLNEYNEALTASVSYFSTCLRPAVSFPRHGTYISHDFPPLWEDVIAYRQQRIGPELETIMIKPTTVIQEQDLREAVMSFRLFTAHPDMLLCIIPGDAASSCNQSPETEFMTYLRSIVREPGHGCMFMYPSVCGICFLAKPWHLWNSIPILPPLEPELVLGALKQSKNSYQARY